MTRTTGILLSNLGTPDSPTASALRPFLREFLSDRRVVEAPRLLWWFVLNLLILPFRPRRSARLYAKIWTDEGSPLLVHSHKLAEGLEHELGGMPVALGMRYGTPSIAQALGTLRNAGCNRIVALSLYPQYSASTVGTSLDAVTSELRQWRDVPELRTVRDYHAEPAYIRELAASVSESWRDHGRAQHLLMSFHGIPQSYADAGDPYPEHCEGSARLLAEALALEDDRWSMAYQSRLGRQPWLSPDTDSELRRLGEAGIESVEVICPGFAADCLETLEEIAMEGQRAFFEAGGKTFRYIPALNDRSGHVRALAEIIAKHTAFPCA